MTSKSSTSKLIPAALGAACLMLGWHIFTYSDGTRSEAIEAPKSASAPSSGMRVEDSLIAAKMFVMPPIKNFSATIDRPLFTETRRPVPVESLPQDGPAPVFPLDLVLKGIVFSETERILVASPKSGGDILRLAEGASYLGWTIETITPDIVTFRRDQVEAELRLSIGAKPSTPSEPAMAGQGGRIRTAPPRVQAAAPEITNSSN